MRRTCRERSSRPRPKSSTPALLLTTVRSREPRSRSAAMRFSGMPHSPKPPTRSLAEEGMSATASAALPQTLSEGERVRVAWHRAPPAASGGAAGDNRRKSVEGRSIILNQESVSRLNNDE